MKIIVNAEIILYTVKGQVGHVQLSIKEEEAETWLNSKALHMFTTVIGSDSYQHD